jgi:hypothetical protein
MSDAEISADASTTSRTGVYLAVLRLGVCAGLVHLRDLPARLARRGRDSRRQRSSWIRPDDLQWLWKVVGPAR